MGVLDRLASGSQRKPAKRNYGGFAAAGFSRLTASMAAQTTFINNTLRYDLRTLRARSRQAAINNPFVKRFISMVVDNVAGPAPFRLEGKAKFKSGSLDERTNDVLEKAWKDWGRLGECEITGKHSWNGLQRLIVRILATDGEVLLRKIRGQKTGRGYRYQLQLIDVDRLWEWKNEPLANNGAISMSVEVDQYGKPVAYHILKRKPAQWQQNSGVPMESERVPAEEIIHIHLTEFAEQIRGIPWVYAALMNLTNIGGFEEAAIIAARIGASSMGFIHAPDGGAQQGGDNPDAEQQKGANPEIEAEPGVFQYLPEGYQMDPWNPKYPDAQVEPFLKAMLRGVASGLNVAYHNVSGDMTDVNYSSARIAELGEREMWKGIQNFVMEHLHQPFYEDWLRFGLLVTGMIKLDPTKIDKYRDVIWQARRWTWVDPKNEILAANAAIDSGITSRTRVIADHGRDVEDVFEEIANEQQLAQDKGITLASSLNPKQSATQSNPDPLDQQQADAASGEPGAQPDGENEDPNQS